MDAATGAGRAFEMSGLAPALGPMTPHAIVGQDQPLIEVYRRRNAWAREVLEPDEDVSLDSVGVTLSRSQVYEEVEF
jgi:hypothetical protein